MRYLALSGMLLSGMLLLGACTTAGQGQATAAQAQGTASQGQGYVRAGGRTNPQHLQLALAQCQGEAAATPQAFYVAGGGWVGLAGSLVARAVQVDSVTSGCMARNGYVVAQQKPHPQLQQVQRDSISLMPRCATAP